MELSGELAGSRELVVAGLEEPQEKEGMPSMNDPVIWQNYTLRCVAVTDIFFLLLSAILLSIFTIHDPTKSGKEYLVYRSIHVRMFDFCIFSVFAWLVPHVSFEIGNYRNLLFAWKENGLLLEGLQAVRNWAGFALLTAGIIMALLAVTVGLMTRNLDYRMHAILSGLSLLIGAVYLFLISIFVPTWSGVYIRTSVMVERMDRSYRTGTLHNLKTLRFHVYWGILRLLARHCVFILPFFSAMHAATIPVSILCGLLFGFSVDSTVYLLRRVKNAKKQERLTLGFAVLIALFSALLFSAGGWYIREVWIRPEDLSVQGKAVLYVASILCWLLVAVAVHVFFLCRSKRLRKAEQTQAASPSSESVPHLYTATSMIMIKMYGKTPLPEAEQKYAMEVAYGEVNPEDEAEVEVKGEGDSAYISIVLARSAAGSPQGVLAEMAEIDCTKETFAPLFSQMTFDYGSSPISASKKDKEADKEEEDPSVCKLILTQVSCCGCLRGEHSISFKLFTLLLWLGWVFLVGFSVFVVIANIGATLEGNRVRVHLPGVDKALYKHMDQGPVCAFDKRGANSNVTTFANKEAAHAAGFLVAHCGECAACSDWHNLRLQWTTRAFLARESKKCATKALFGGPEATQACLEAPPLNFGPECASCWTTDILCTKKNCIWIYLQSTLINAAGDFKVGPESITSASCEEAFCEVGQFVPCSGATRRRMNIKSDIVRPGAQQCGIVDIPDWKLCHGRCHESRACLGIRPVGLGSLAADHPEKRKHLRACHR
eukprot:g56426.t1